MPEPEVADAYRVLRSVNRQLGNLRSMSRELRRFLGEEGPGRLGDHPPRPGVGIGRHPRALRDELGHRRSRGPALALDRDPTAVELARGGGLDVVRGDALRLPFDDASIDLVTAIKFAHHFRDDALARLVAEMARVARRRVIVLDIRRHWLAYWGFVAWSRLRTRNRLVRFDGPLSVLRGFTADELLGLTASLPAFDWAVRSAAGFQLLLVGRRRDDAGPTR